MKQTIFKISFADGKSYSQSLTPILPAQYIATVAPVDDGYDGTYGIDWCELDDTFTNIVSFQETKVADITHTLDEATTQFIKITGGTDKEKEAAEAKKQQLIRKLYGTTSYYGKDYPITWVHLTAGKKALLKITPVLIEGKKNSADFFTIEKNAHFKITYKKTTDEGKNPPITLDNLKKKGVDIEIEALSTFAEPQFIRILDVNEVEVGRIEMAANELESLDIKIIPIVFKSTKVKEKEEATILYKKALNNGELLKGLNEKGLGQLGIQCSIEAMNISTPEYVAVDLTDPKKNWGEFYDKGVFKDWDFPKTESLNYTP